MNESKKILVVTCSKGDGKDTQLVQSLNPLKDDISLVINANNSTGLAKAYNKQLVPENLIKHDIVLFVHDDVFIDDLKLKGKLVVAMNNLKYDIVGLAGAKSVEIKEPCLWHLMTERRMMSGSVSHPTGNNQLAVTCFGPWPQRCLVMDGLFLAVNLSRALEVGWKFDEDFMYHHYDIAACLTANKLKMKMGTYPINVTHSSPGLGDLKDETFVKSQKIFIDKYKHDQ
jgi:hypothetical protein